MRLFFFIFLITMGAVHQVFSQDSKYRSIQGIGYLHTQTALILTNWEHHPLNHLPMGEQEAMVQKHFLQEIEHDEEWVDQVLVESNLFDQFREHIDEKVEDALRENIEFYTEVLQALHEPKRITEHREQWLEELVKANIRLYDIIYPALCK